jgi:hypothetical protein
MFAGAGSAPIRPLSDPLAAQASALEACKVFTIEEVGKAAGRTFRRARPGSGPGGTTCDFLGGPEGSINVAITPSSSKKEFDDLKKLYAENGETVEPVNGVGDDAYWVGTRIYVRVDVKWLVIWNGDSSQPVARARNEVLAVAKLGVPKLR